jgi:hypothetical protein
VERLQLNYGLLLETFLFKPSKTTEKCELYFDCPACNSLPPNYSSFLLKGGTLPVENVVGIAEA